MRYGVIIGSLPSGQKGEIEATRLTLGNPLLAQRKGFYSGIP